MLTSYVIDSSVYVSAIQPADVFHRSSQKLLALFATHRLEILLPALVVAEVTNVIHRAEGSSAADLRQYIKGMVEHPATTLLPLDEVFFNKVMLPIPKVLKLKSSDFVIAMSAVSTKSILISWDKAMLKSAAKHIRCMTPDQFFE